MNKIIICLTIFLVIHLSYADEQLNTETINQHQLVESSSATQSQDYISRGNYIQNPYIGMPSAGGTQELSESDFSRDNIAKKWFADGTWNIYAAASYVDQNGSNNYGNAVNMFAQTGEVAGFSFGGLVSITNPFFSQQWNPAAPENQAQWLPIAQQIMPQELFAEYKYSNVVQADIGWIGISNSPWMTYAPNYSLNLVTYQGAIVNVNPGAGWLLTGFAINGAKLLGEDGFSQQTMYNDTWDMGTGTGNIANAGSPSTIAVGANWNSSNELIELRLWGYQFTDLANMAYADSTIKLPINNDSGFTLGFQGALQDQNGSGNILNSNGYGSSVNSNMLGTQLGFEYQAFAIQVGYNNIWGPSNGYNSGGLISPYTYQYATDPLFTTGWLQGMVERSSGQAYKIAPSLTLLDSNLVITPSYQYYASTIIPASSEYDLQINYTIPEIKGLSLFGVYGYLTNVSEDGSASFLTELMVSYLY